MNVEEAQYLSVKEVARRTGLPTRVIYDMARRRENPIPHLRVGHLIHIDASLYQDYIKRDFGRGYQL